MPGNPPTSGDVLELEVLTAITNQVGVNILHYNVTTVTTGGATLQEICNGMDLVLNIFYKNILCNAATYRGVGLSNISGLRTAQVVSTAHAGPGTAGANLIPTQVRGLISTYSNLAGPRYRGRIYVPFPSANGADAAGLPTPAYVVILDALRAAIIAPRTIGGVGGNTTIVPSIAHRKDVPVSASEVQISVARTRFATQRKSGAYGRVNTPPF